MHLDLVYKIGENNNVLKELVTTRITTVQYEGKSCYAITNSYNACIYVDKETGLVLKKTEEITMDENEKLIETQYKYKYEFNKVTEENLKQPDIRDYEVK